MPKITDFQRSQLRWTIACDENLDDEIGKGVVKCDADRDLREAAALARQMLAEDDV